MIRVRFVGSGGAFGDGGRFQACILLETDGYRAALDFGATSLVALKQAGVEPNAIDAVLLTHFHGDHAGGVPYLILDGQFRKRDRGLTIAGPAPLRQRVDDIFEAALPTSSATRQRFSLEYVELSEVSTRLGPLEVSALPVAHLDATSPHGLRVRVGGRTIAYTGDTDWHASLPRLADGADLFIAECYSVDKAIPQHLSHGTLVAHASELRAKRIVLTHPGVETLARERELRWELARDGMVVEL